MDSATSIDRSQFVRPIVLGVVMTTIAEVFYLVVWGLILFPAGDIVAKVAWTLTCGIAMGSVIGSATVAFVTGRLHGTSALYSAAVIFFVVGTVCAVLCSRIDARFNVSATLSTGLFWLDDGAVRQRRFASLGWRRSTAVASRSAQALSPLAVP